MNSVAAKTIQTSLYFSVSLLDQTESHEQSANTWHPHTGAVLVLVQYLC